MEAQAGRVMGDASDGRLVQERLQDVVRVRCGSESRERNVMDLDIAMLFHELALVDENFVVSLGIFAEEARRDERRKTFLVQNHAIEQQLGKITESVGNRHT